ncbi:hypothetical protein DKT68_05745 [Micromonospora acroterricola]|uniref:Uncharacterized protein n=1 Tax=Micromonospora acroterricola TaxID=2202421 RepID=A0A317DAF6_9ACTN|nr:hypothetical protein DKT68_05745 [Micromonospora acroterricola]
MLRSLRELTRLAVTALVLAVGLGGALAATPPPASAQLRPSAVSSRVDTLRPDALPAAEWASQPAESRPATTVAVTAPVTVVPEHAPADDPGRGIPLRRGPPAL